MLICIHIKIIDVVNMIESNKEKQLEEDEAEKVYLSKITSIKQHYGIELKIDYFQNQSINKIKFLDLDYNSNIKNIVLLYDNKIGKFNYLSYDYDGSSLKKINDRKLINDLQKDKKLKLIVQEIDKANKEYLLRLKQISEKYKINSKVDGEIPKELEIKRKPSKI